MPAERTTKKQQQLLEFVKEFISKHSYGPSYREIMSGLGYKSVSTVAVHVEALVAKGFLERTDGSIRSLKVAGSANVRDASPSSTAESEIRQLITSLSKDETKVDDVKALVRSLELLGCSTKDYEERGGEPTLSD